MPSKISKKNNNKKAKKSKKKLRKLQRGGSRNTNTENTEKFKREFNIMLSQADQNNDESEFIVGQIYLDGTFINRGIPQNLEKGLYYLNRAAEKGHIGSLLYIGNYYYKNKQNKEAFTFYEKAVKKGNEEINKYNKDNEYNEEAKKNIAEANFLLGYMYYTGKGTQKDYDKAFELCKKAVDEGNTEGNFVLSMMYYEGKGTGINYDKAFELCKKAVDEGNTEGNFLLSMMYYEGKGTKRNHDKAVELCKKAADEGNIQAKNYLKNVINNSIEFLPAKPKIQPAESEVQPATPAIKNIINTSGKKYIAKTNITNTNQKIKNQKIKMINKQEEEYNI